MTLLTAVAVNWYQVNKVDTQFLGTGHISPNVFIWVITVGVIF